MTSVLVGAIRWDAWYGQFGATTASRQAQNQLSTLAWRGRLPWFSTAVSDYQMNASGTQANMDLEIKLAVQAGLSYWSFDTYGQYQGGVNNNPDLATGLTLYLASSFSSQIKWCANNTPGQLVGPGGFAATAEWQAVIANLAALMTDSRYLKVLTNRPMMHMRWNDATITGSIYGGYTNFKTVIAYLNGLLVTAGLGNVYLVVLSGNLAATYLAAASADAISDYTSHFVISGALPMTYASLDTQTQATWVTQAATGSPIIPICQTGWDLRPEHATPQPLEIPSPGHGPIGFNQTVTPGTTTQITAGIVAACAYVKANTAACPSNTVLVYSWTECSEGGSALIPTVGDPPSNVDSGQPLLTSNQLASLGAALRATP